MTTHGQMCVFFLHVFDMIGYNRNKKKLYSFHTLNYRVQGDQRVIKHVCAHNMYGDLYSCLSCHFKFTIEKGHPLQYVCAFISDKLGGGTYLFKQTNVTDLEWHDLVSTHSNLRSGTASIRG